MCSLNYGLVSKSEIPGRYKAMIDRLNHSLTPIIERARADPDALDRARKRHRKKAVSRAHPPYTRDLLSILTDYLVVNRSMKLDSTGWMDILHLVVPVSYVVFALLDERWTHFVRAEVPLAPPNIARVFSGRDVPSFLAALGACQ